MISRQLWSFANGAIMALALILVLVRPAAPQGTEAVVFAIPPQPLASALTALSEQTGLSFAYDSDALAGISSPGADGLLTPQDALNALLAGTAVSYRFLSDDTIALALTEAVPGQVSPAGGQVIRLDPITVTGARFATPVSELPSSNTILERDDLQAQPSFQRDAVGGLANVTPGFNFTSPLGSDAKLRGREVSFRINNIEINQRFRPAGNAIFDLPSAAFGRVEVVRGADATFGFGASGGAVNFRTPEPIPGETQLQTTFGLSIQPANVGDSISPSLRQSVTGSLGKVDYWLEFGGDINQTLFDADGDPLPDSDSSFPNSNVFDANASFSMSLDDDQSVEMTHFFVYTDQEPEFVAIPTGDVDAGIKTPTAPATEFSNVFDDSFRRQYIGTLSYKNEDVFGSRVDVTAFYQDRVLRQIPGEIVSPLIIQLREENRRIGVRASAETPLSFLDGGWLDGAALTWGLDFQRFRYEAEEVLDPAVPFGFGVLDATELSTAGFAQLRLPVFDQFLITGGVRYEVTDVEIGSADLTPAFGGAFEGGDLDYDLALFNAGLVYFVTDEVELYGSFSQAADVLDLARAPRLPEVQSVTDIRTEASKTNQYEVGVRGAWNRVQASAAVFYSESDLANQFSVLPGTTFAAPIRRPQQIWGAEVTVDVQPTEKWGVGGTVSFSDGTTELENGDIVDLSANDTQPLRLTGYVEHRPFPWWRNRLQVSHQFSADASPALGLSGVEPLTFVDLYSEFQVGPGELRVGVENLFNRTEFNPTAQINRDGLLGQIAYVPFPGTTISAAYAATW
ncbi:MAG: TonB-dependent receptor [Pseudomonadota bacterium]